MKNIEKIELGRYEMETWYYSPFPPEYRDCKVRKRPRRRAGWGHGPGPLGLLPWRSAPRRLRRPRAPLSHSLCPPLPYTPPVPAVPQKLYFCEYDLQFFKHRHQMLRHLRKVKLLHPPGTEIYRNGNISMFEVRAVGCGW